MTQKSDRVPAADGPELFGDQGQHARMFQLIWSFTASQIVHALARYSFADHLAAEPRTAQHIAERESLDVDATARLLRACASMGLVSYDGQGKFSTTALLDTLRAGAEGSLRGAALLIPASGHWLPWGRLSDAVKTGSPQAVAALGQDAWAHLAQHPDELAAFADTMKSVSTAFNREARSLIDTRSVSVAVDVGGANGTLVHALMEQNPSLRGVVFDLPHVVGGAAQAVADRPDLRDRFSVVAGDFLAVPPPPADLYLLKLILHDWNDEDAMTILRNCRQGIKPGGRILVIEHLLGEMGAPGPTTMMDLNMMVVLGGRERQLVEYQALLTAAGFRFSSSTPTRTPLVVIEALAV